MEFEVSVLMGAEDKVIWNSVGLFTTDEELQTLAGGRNIKATDTIFKTVKEVDVSYSPIS